MRNNTTLKMLGLIIISFLILKYDGQIINSPGVVKVIDFLATGVLLFAGIWFVLTKTKDGKRIKQDLIDPIIKPTGSETQDWDSETGAPRSRKDSVEDTTGKAKGINRRYLIIVIGVIAVFVIVAMTITMPSGLSNMYDQSDAVEQMIGGVFSGDSSATAEGGKRFLSTVWIDLRGILIMFLVLVVIIGISYLVFSLVRSKRRNRFTQQTFKEDADDDYWSS